MRVQVFASSLLILGMLVGCTSAAPTPVPKPTDAVQTAVPDPTATLEVTPTAEEILVEPTATPDATSEEQAHEATVVPVPTEPQEPSLAGWQADGVIGQSEYAHTAEMGKVTVHWRNDDQTLFLGLVGQATGWVSIGLDPEQRMKGADYVIGVVRDGQVQVWDAYGTAAVGNTHPEDASLGGQDDIIAFGGSEVDGVTTIEVAKPLDSGGAYDKRLIPGQTYPVIVGVSGSDDFGAIHSYRGGGDISLD